MKKNRYKLLAGCALAVIYSSNVAVAMPVTATDTVTLPGGSVYMSGSGINTYTFDINSYLGSGFTAPYNLSNVSILASFMDDQNDGITRSNESNLGSYVWTSGPDYYGGGTQRRNGTADFTEEQETAGLTAGASSYYSSTSSSAGGTYSQSQSDGSTQAGYHSGSCSWGWCSGGHYHYINKYTDYAGDLTRGRSQLRDSQKG
ncbi:MAG: hypothetical protein L3J50_07475 [Emcibacter sp.]|nr:hypothetical protein [Emcibacter sp.]